MIGLKVEEDNIVEVGERVGMDGTVFTVSAASRPNLFDLDKNAKSKHESSTTTIANIPMAPNLPT